MNPREALHEKIQDSLNGDDHAPDAGMLMGWVCIAEVMDGSGERWLTAISGDSRGEAVPVWQASGYFHHMLYDWDAACDCEPDD